MFTWERRIGDMKVEVTSHEHYPESVYLVIHYKGNQIMVRLLLYELESFKDFLEVAIARYHEWLEQEMLREG